MICTGQSMTTWWTFPNCHVDCYPVFFLAWFFGFSILFSHFQNNCPNQSWLVVYLPLWKIWVRQLGSLFPIYGKIIQMFQTTNQNLIQSSPIRIGRSKSSMVEPPAPASLVFSFRGSSRRRRVASWLRLWLWLNTFRQPSKNEWWLPSGKTVT